MYFFLRKRIRRFPYGKLNCCRRIHAEQWCLSLSWWQKWCCMAPKTHLKMKSVTLAKKILCVKNNCVKKVSVPKHLLLPFILNLYLKKPPSLFMNWVLVQIQNLTNFPLLGLAFTREIAALKISVSEILWHNTWQTWAALSVEKLRKQLTCLSHLCFL